MLPKGFPNAALLMRYLDGDDSSGRHRDDEPDLGYERAIIGISLGEPGAERTLKFQRVSNDSTVAMVLLQPGDALLMLGYSIQEHFTHELVKEKVSLLFEPEYHLTPSHVFLQNWPLPKMRICVSFRHHLTAQDLKAAKWQLQLCNEAVQAAVREAQKLAKRLENPMQFALKAVSERQAERWSQRQERAKRKKVD
jgi:hypothetical protein